jgi:hypothetical protein
VRVQSLPSGAIVYKQGTSGNTLHILRRGHVRLLQQVCAQLSSVPIQAPAAGVIAST